MPTQQHINWPRLIFWGISYLSLVGSPVISYGNPVEPNVVRGAAEFSNPATGHLLINQHTQRAVIDWQSFNIDAGELTEFRLPSSDSVSLNRVSGTGQSLIDGRLTSNGNVFLLNPNGVIIGKNGSIDVGGFVASSLDLDNDQFMVGGELNFHGDSKAPVINLGKIGASTGDIILIAPQVTNEGSLIAPNGRVGLAAGSDVLLKVDGDECVFVRNAKTKGGVLNKGIIEANVAELKAHDGNVYGMAIQNEGRVNAKTLTKEGGKIYLRSGRGKISNTGSLEAKGGDVRIDAGPAGEVEVAGTLDTTSDTWHGGSITITGKEIDLTAGALVIADGLFGGGDIKIGGGRRGQDLNLHNATNVTIAEGAIISANATLKGNAGSVILFAENTLAFEGRISADGGLQGGDGGFIELSGQNEIYISQLFGKVSLKAGTGGKAGTLLIDPDDIFIGITPGAPITGSPVNANTLNDMDIALFLQSMGNLVIETTNGTVGAGNIAIDPMVNIFWSSDNNLTFNATGNFTNNGLITTTGMGAITVNAGGNFTNTGNISLMGLSGAIVVNAVQQLMLGPGSVLSAAGAGTISLSTDRNIVLGPGSSVLTQDGNLTLTANAMGLTAGSFVGVHVDGGLIQASGMGEVSVTGRGGNGGTGVSGIIVDSSGAIFGGTTGKTMVTGTSGISTANFSIGVVLSDPGSIITSSGADVELTGMSLGMGGSAQGYGVSIQGGGVVSAGGIGSVVVSGTGGDGMGPNQHGVVLQQTGSEITSGGGDILIEGITGMGVAGMGIFLLSSGTVSTLSNGGSVTLVADSMDIAAPIGTGSGGSVTLLGFTPGTLIDLGGVDSAGTLGLTDAELDNITTETLDIGDMASGAITISSNISRSIPGALLLTTGSSVTGTTGGIEVDRLAIDSFSGVNITAASTNVTNLAISVANGSITFIDTDDFTVDIVGDLFGISAFSGNVNLTAGGAGAITTVGGQGPIIIGANTVSLTAGTGLGTNLDPLFLDALDLVTNTSSLNGDQFLISATMMGSTVLGTAGLNAGTGTITLLGGTFDTGGNERIANSSSLHVDGATLNLGMNNETLAAFSITNGMVNGGSGNLTVSGPFTASGGAFNATSGTLNIGGDFTAANLSFVAGTGTVSLNSALTLNSAARFNNLILNTTGIITLAADAAVDNTLTINNIGSINGSGGPRRFNASKDIISNDNSFTMSNAAFAFTDMGFSRFNATAGGNQGVLIIDKLNASDVARIDSHVTFNSVTIDEGILDVNYWVLTSPVNVNAGGTLGGNGAVGNVTVFAGGRIGPGPGPGLLNIFGNLSFGSGAFFNADINGLTTAGLDFDHLNVMGTLDLGGATLTTAGMLGPLSADGSITIISNDIADAVTGTFAGLVENDIVNINGNNFRITYAGGDGNDVALIYELPAFLTAMLDGFGNGVITDIETMGVFNNFTIFNDGLGNLVISDANERFSVSGILGASLSMDRKTLFIPVSSITGTNIIFNAGGGDDILTANLTLSLGKNLVFNGGGQTTADSLILNGATGTNSITHAFTNANDGSITLAGVVAGAINYTGLEPITDNLVANDRIFNFNGGAETISLVAAGSVTNTIDSTLGESVTFTNPTGSLFINAGTGDDIILINSLAATFSAGLSIAGDGGTDAVTLLGGLPTLGSLVIVTDTLSALPALSISGNINITTAGSITSAGGVITANAISLTAGSSLGTNLNPLLLDTLNLVTNTSSLNGDQFLISATMMGSTVFGAAGLNAGNGTIALLGGTFDTGGNERIANSSSLHVNGATLNLGMNNETLAAFSITNGLVNGGSGNLTVSGPFTASGGAFNATSGTLNIGGDFTAANLSFVAGTGTVSLNSALTLNSAALFNNLILNTTGIITLAANASVNGNLTINNIGAINGSGGLRRLNSLGFITSNDSSFTMTNAAFALIGGGINGFAATAGGNQGTLIIDMSNNGALAYIGSNLTFNSVTIAEGILDLAGFTLSSPVDINTGGSLRGSGTVGNVTVFGGGRLGPSTSPGPGTGPGLINTGNLTFTSGAFFNADVNGLSNPGVQFDLVNVMGTLNLGGILNIAGMLGLISTGGSITIISNDIGDAVTGTFAGLAENGIVNINGNNFRISYLGGDGNDVVLALSVGPSTITQVTNTNSNNLNNIPLGPPPPTSRGGGPPRSNVATVTDNFSGDSGGPAGGGGSSGTTSGPRIGAVELITQRTTPTTTTTTEPKLERGAGDGAEPVRLFTSITAPVVPTTSVTAPPVGSAPQGPVSIGGGSPPSIQVQTQITQSTNPQSKVELRSSLGLLPEVSVDNSEGPLAVGLRGVAPAPQTKASLRAATSDSAFVELAMAAGFNPAVSVGTTDGAGAMNPQGPPSTPQTKQSLSEATSPAAAQSLSLALGGDGTAPTSAGDGPASVGRAGLPPKPVTEASLASNISSGSASELSVSLGGTGETTALGGGGLMTMDASGTPPSEQTTQSLQTTTSAQEESELSMAMGLTGESTAESTDNSLSIDLSGQKPPAEAIKFLQENLNEASAKELSDSLNE